MRLEFDNVRFKNFLSFGSKWQEIEFSKGINILTGRNGSGKSSCMETIPFALFGKTHKDIKKADLINWKNRKGLEVHLTLFKGDEKLKIIRAIKPDNFEIYRNDNLIEKPSNVRDYQATLEDILGINLQVFSGIVHSNINTSQPIFAMSKPDKRKFIERSFGLTIYSDMVKNCNAKITSITNKLREIDLENNNCQSVISESERHIADIANKIKGLKSSAIELMDCRDEIKSIQLMDEASFRDIEKDLQVLNNTLISLEEVRNRVNVKAVVIGSKVKDLDRKIPKDFQKRQFRNGLKELLEENTNIASQKQEELKSTEREILLLDSEIKHLKERMNQLKSGICPTCGQSIKSSDIKDMKDEYESLSDKHKRLREKKHSIDTDLERLIQEEKSISDELRNYETYQEEERRVSLYTEKLNRYKSAYVRMARYRDAKDKEIQELNNNKSILQETVEEEKAKQRKMALLKSKEESLEKQVLLEDDTKKEMQSLISSDRKTIENKKAILKNNEATVEKLNNIKDYVEYIKSICSDEKIKAYAIKTLMPYLNRRVNKYLSDIGHSFYLYIDNWLEPTIKGPGIPSGSYFNLSSGEAKSVDLSLQNAMLDIARIRAGVFPDILIMDELLDSSLDSSNLSTLLQIVSNKQQQDDSKVYIISHREEVGEIENANIIKLVKEGGYSKIQEA